MREVVDDGLRFGFWVVLVVCLVGLLVSGWFGALLGLPRFLFGYGGCCVVLFAGFRVLVWQLCLLLCFKYRLSMQVGLDYLWDGVCLRFRVVVAYSGWL